MQLQRIKVFVESISTIIEKKGKKPYRIMTIIKPAPRDNMGDGIYKDDIFPVLIGESKLPLVSDLKKGDKIAIDLFLTGQQWFDNNHHIQCTMLLKLYRLEKLPKDLTITETVNVQKSH